MNALEIAKILTISTKHITEQTSELLKSQNQDIASSMGIISYEKDEYGWFVFINVHLMKETLTNASVPEDLKKCMQLAADNECCWLCLDRDANTINRLPVYEW